MQPGDTLILDNLATRKLQRVGQILSDRGVCLRYLPSCSPDLNPIELAFAKLEAHLRQAAARTLVELQSAVAGSLDRFSASDIFRRQNFFAFSAFFAVPLLRAFVV